MPDEAVIARLSRENYEYSNLKEDHRRYDDELAELYTREFLSSDQQARVRELKKLKLNAKDRMEAMLRLARKDTVLA